MTMEQKIEYLLDKKPNDIYEYIDIVIAAKKLIKYIKHEKTPCDMCAYAEYCRNPGGECSACQYEKCKCKTCDDVYSNWEYKGWHDIFGGD